MPQFGDELSLLAPDGALCSLDMAYIHIVVQLYSPRAVQLHLFQGLAHDVVRLVLRLLGGLDDRGLVEIALVVDIELAKGILQPEDLALLELGVLPARNALLATVEAGGCVSNRTGPTYFCSLIMFILAEDCESERSREGRQRVMEEAKVSAWLSLVLSCAFFRVCSGTAYQMTTWGALPSRALRGAVAACSRITYACHVAHPHSKESC